MNPYEVLGVSENADEETIKRAYKELVKKYHPDKYVNNPLADLAAEKMKEINKAYDMLTKTNTSSGGNYGGYNGGYNTGGFGGYGSYQNATPTFSMVRQGSSLSLCTVRNMAYAEICMLVIRSMTVRTPQQACQYIHYMGRHVNPQLRCLLVLM